MLWRAYFVHSHPFLSFFFQLLGRGSQCLCFHQISFRDCLKLIQTGKPIDFWFRCWDEKSQKSWALIFEEIYATELSETMRYSCKEKYRYSFRTWFRVYFLVLDVFNILFKWYKSEIIFHEEEFLKNLSMLQLTLNSVGVNSHIIVSPLYL